MFTITCLVNDKTQPGFGLRAKHGLSFLVETEEEIIDEIISTLRDEYGFPRLYLNHCMGNRALRALRRAFPDRVVPCPAGMKVAF